MNCWFSYNNGPWGALNASGANAGTSIRFCVFLYNRLPLYINTNYSLDGRNTFTENTANGIYVHSGYNVASDITWGETQAAYVIQKSQFCVNAGCTLTLDNGVVLKFVAGGELFLADGSGGVANHGGPGVALTSYRDDSRLGDSLGDGPTTGAAGDWLGVYNDDYSVSAYITSWDNIYFDSYADI